MSDTTVQECKCCATDGDCIEGLCLSCREYGNKSITEHPDVQRLIGQVVELQAENKRLKDKKLIPCVTCDIFNENDNLKEALERAHEELTKNPDWPETRREHEISEIIERALEEDKKAEVKP